MTVASERIRSIREIRRGMLMSLEDAADALGVSVSQLARVERGEAKASEPLYEAIKEIFGQEVFVPAGITTYRKQTAQQVKKDEAMTEGERRFLKTCWNMRDALYAERIIMRDLVDATYEFMEECEAITYLYKWSKIGFYHYAKGGVVDQGYIEWEKLPKKYRRVVNK